MTTRNITLRPGRAAIAAVLALASTSAFSQDPAPTIVLPGETAAPAPIAAPPSQVVVPEISEPVAVPAPVAAPEPAPTVAETPTRRAAATPARSSRVNTNAPRAAAAPTVAASSVNASDIAVPAPPVTEPLGTTGNVAPIEAADATIQPVAPTEVGGDTQREDVTEALALMLGGLLLAGVSVGAFVLLMRNRRRRRAETLIEPTFAAEPPVRDSTPTWSNSAPRAATVPAYASAPIPSAAAVALPRVAPTDPVERGELLKRMVAAEPDKANPFTSPKARLRRARLILQSLGQKFESGKPRFDLSDYTSNWTGINRNGRLATT